MSVELAVTPRKPSPYQVSPQAYEKGALTPIPLVESRFKKENYLTMENPSSNDLLNTSLPEIVNKSRSRNEDAIRGRTHAVYSDRENCKRVR